jgi:dolichol-phosphate mannosyltransferase
MDGDLQYDEKRLPDLLAQVQSGAADIAVASRYVTAGQANGLAAPWRRWLSQSGIRFLRTVLPVPTADPLSGFFVLRRDLFQALAPA